MPAKLIVTGCGRTGSQYLSSVLQRIGIRASHESIYQCDETGSPRFVSCKWTHIEAEASWLALPSLWATKKDTVVWHILRDPRKVYRCWTEHKLLKPDGSYQPESPVTKFVHSILPECSQGTNEERVIKYILGWNSLIERELKAFSKWRRFRIESLNAQYLQFLLEGVGYKFSLDQIQEALSSVSTDHGTCRHTTSVPEWDAIENHARGRELHEKAYEWGYQ